MSLSRAPRAPRNIERDYCTNIAAARIALQIVSDVLTGQNGAEYQQDMIKRLMDERIAHHRAEHRLHRRVTRWVKAKFA